MVIVFTSLVNDCMLTTSKVLYLTMNLRVENLAIASNKKDNKTERICKNSAFTKQL